MLLSKVFLFHCAKKIGSELTPLLESVKDLNFVWALKLKHYFDRKQNSDMIVENFVFQ